jgi:hypothetical protein
MIERQSGEKIFESELDEVTGQFTLSHNEERLIYTSQRILLELRN